MSGYTEIALLQYELAKLHTRVAELEERRCEVCGYAEHHREHTGCLRNQVSSLKAELREINAAIDDPACDLTHTAAECIKKLKAENESLRKDAELWRGYQKRKQDLLDRGFLRSPLRAELDATAQGEKK